MGLGRAGGRFSAGPALPAARHRLAFLDACGQTGEIFADAAKLGLDARHHARREFSSGLGDDELDQHQQKLVEPVCRGKGGGVFHPIMLVYMT